MITKKRIIEIIADELFWVQPTGEGKWVTVENCPMYLKLKSVADKIYKEIKK